MDMAYIKCCNKCVLAQRREHKGIELCRNGGETNFGGSRRKGGIITGQCAACFGIWIIIKHSDALFNGPKK